MDLRFFLVKIFLSRKLNGMVWQKLSEKFTSRTKYIKWTLKSFVRSGSILPSQMIPNQNLYQKQKHRSKRRTRNFHEKCVECVICLVKNTKKAFFLLKGLMQLFKIFKRKNYAKLITNILNDLYSYCCRTIPTYQWAIQIFVLLIIIAQQTGRAVLTSNILSILGRGGWDRWFQRLSDKKSSTA